MNGRKLLLPSPVDLNATGNDREWSACMESVVDGCLQTNLPNLCGQRQTKLAGSSLRLQVYSLFCECARVGWQSWLRMRAPDRQPTCPEAGAFSVQLPTTCSEQHPTNLHTQLRHTGTQSPSKLINSCTVTCAPPPKMTRLHPAAGARCRAGLLRRFERSGTGVIALTM